MLKDDPQEQYTGHIAGMKDIDAIGVVPVWINKAETIPEDICHVKLKDWIVTMYKKYEVDNTEYQKWKEKKKSIQK